MSVNNKNKLNYKNWKKTLIFSIYTSLTIIYLFLYVFFDIVICSDNPGLIASAGLRNKIWTILLLGSSVVQEDSGLVNSYEPCGEMNVLEADVQRTRSSIDIFKWDLLLSFFH